jgi:hypothetical protein
MIILPRQARDKHRENSKKDAVFRTELAALLSCTDGRAHGDALRYDVFDEPSS